MYDSISVQTITMGVLGFLKLLWTCLSLLKSRTAAAIMQRNSIANIDLVLFMSCFQSTALLILLRAHLKHKKFSLQHHWPIAAQYAFSGFIMFYLYYFGLKIVL